MKKQLTTMLLVISLAMAFLLLAGCQGSSGDSAADVIISASEKAEKAESMTYDINIDMGMLVQGTEYSMNMTGTVQMKMDPVLMAMDLNADTDIAGTNQNMTMKMYSQQEGDNYTVYTGVGNESEGLTWTQSQMDISQMNQYNAQSSMKLYIDAADTFEKQGTEQVNGEDATSYTATIKAESINEVIKESGMLSQFSQLGIDEQQINSMMEIKEDVPVTLWISDTSGEIVQYSVDLTDYMKAYLAAMMSEAATTSEGSSASSAAIEVTKMVETMTITGYDNVDSIEIPEEAKQ